ncbi:MAG TPA: sugar transferase [Panacibacter sp.]|nr:sugar transferase [Panacibacter sp.]
MIQHQEVIEVEHSKSYIAHHVNLRAVPRHEQILSANFSNWYGKAIRAFDILISLALFITFIISIPFIWLANFITSPGPLFYRQIRVGKNGRNFTIIKFRSMHINAESDGEARFTEENDERITAVGSFLRKSRIDELPQVINILRGDMSLVGPRPERPEFVALFVQRNPDYALRNLVKPGLTGWGQVKYKYTSNMEDGLKKLEYDLYFLKHRSFSMDFEIMWRTFVAVMSRSGV